MTLYGGAMLYTTTWYTGPGVLLSKQVWGDATVRNDCEHTRRRWKDQAAARLLVKSATGTITPEDKEMAKAIQAGALEAFSKDFEIWQNKTPALKPMAMKTEGPFLKGRKWHSQFYARDDIQATQETVNGIYHVPGVQTPAERDHAIDDGLPI